MAVVKAEASTTGKASQAARQSASRVVPAIPRSLGQSRREKQNIGEHAEEASAERRVDTKDAEPGQSEQATPTQNASEPQATAVTLTPDVPIETYAEVNGTNIVSEEGVTGGSQRTKVDHREGSGVSSQVEPAGEQGDSFHSGLLSFQLTRPPEEGQTITTPTASQPPTHQTSQIPSTLPPPFYPSQLPSNPPSVSSGSMQATPQPSNMDMPHQPSAGHGLVFGGHRDSSNASPAPNPPQNVYQPYPFMQPYAGPVPPSMPHVHSGHAYHYSEPHVPYPPPLGYGPSYGPPHQQPRPFYPPQGRYPPSSRRPQDYSYSPRMQPAPLPAQVNSSTTGPGPRMATNPANDASKAIHPDMMRDIHGQDSHQRQHPSVSQSDSHSQFDLKGPLAPEDQASMARYLVSQFGNPEFADYVLHLSHATYQFPPTSLPGHGILLARSPKFRSLMSMPANESQDGHRVLNVPVSDRFLNVDHALMRAIMRLYGEALPNRHDIAHLATLLAAREGSSAESAQMRFALALAASGHFLQLDEVISHGLLMAGHLLSWSTLPQALAFALEGGLSMNFTNANSMSRDETSVSSDGSQPNFDSPSSAPAYGYYSDRLLNHILSFIAHNIPITFGLSPAAQQLSDPPRLPVEAEPKRSRPASSRLSQIRFGEMTLEDPTSTDPLTTAISSTLLSLPFPLLQNISESNVLGERLSWSRVAELMAAVVQERERRRERAVSNRPVNADDHGLWRTVRFVEAAESTERFPMSVKLTRRHTGIETLPSAESGKA